MSTGSMGFQGKVAIDSASITTGSPGFDFDECGITMESEIIDASGQRGSRERYSERTREGIQRVGGTMTIYPSGGDLVLLLPWILGGDASGSSYPLAETLPVRNIMVDKVAKVYTYAGCKVSRATFSCAENQPMKLSLDTVGQTETEGDPGTFPVLTTTNAVPYVFFDSVLTMLSSARKMKSFTLTIDNHLLVEFHNSQTATLIQSQDRTITLDFPSPWAAAETDLYRQAVAGAAASLALDNGDKTLTFSFATLQVPSRGPVLNGRTEIPLQISAVARRVSTTPSLAVTLADD